MTNISPTINLISTKPNQQFIMRTAPTQTNYLNPTHTGFEINTIDRTNLILNNINLQQLTNHHTLLSNFNQFRQQIKTTNHNNKINEFHQQTFEILTSPQLAQTLDLNHKDPNIQQHYKLNHKYPNKQQKKTHLNQFLLAHQIIETKTHYVTISFNH